MVGSAVDTMVWSSAASSSTRDSTPKIIRIDGWGTLAAIAMTDACQCSSSPPLQPGAQALFSAELLDGPKGWPGPSGPRWLLACRPNEQVAIAAFPARIRSHGLVPARIRPEGQ